MQPNRLRSHSTGRRTLMRGADGRLRPDDGKAEIADVWEQQRRLELNQAINQRRKREARKQLRRERGVAGLAALYIKRHARRIRTALFGAAAPKTTPPADRPKASANKTVEVIIAMPSLPVSAGLINNRLRAILQSRKALVGLALIMTLAVSSYLFWQAAGPAENQPAQVGTPATAAADKPTALQKGTPDYPTLLPAGKTIDSLGGWTRISPPDSNPVFAYVDSIDSVRISVSQQPLPSEFNKNTAQKVKEMAAGYGADEAFVAGSTDVHIGASTKGPQSVIFNRNQTLVLIKSVAPIDNSRWVSYINSLR